MKQNIITEFVALTIAVRKSQKAFFRAKSATDEKRKYLYESKALEERLDKLISENSAFLAEHYTESLVSSFDHQAPIAPKQGALFS